MPRRLAATAVVLLAAILPACGGGSEPAPKRPSLAVGLTDFNPNLVWSSGSGHTVPPSFAAARDAVTALRPAYFRIPVNWAAAQPSPDRAPRWNGPDGACEPGPLCAPWGGLREQLRAVRSQQRAAGGGWEVVLSLGYTPAWAAVAPGTGCEPPGGSPESRAVAPSALPGYRAMIDSLLALGREEHVALRWWSAWNEPNAGTGITPERAACDPAAPAVAPATYVELVRNLRATLDRAPGEQRILIGEISSPRVRRQTIATTPEFLAALPDDVICAGDVWAQHEYVGDADVVPALELDLDHRRCGRGLPIWITETGVGGPRPGKARPTDPAALRAQCRAMDDTLRRWRSDPRVQAAFQYTYREDPNFPVGLADVSLTTRYPVHDLWRAWGGARVAGAPAPALPSSCR